MEPSVEHLRNVYSYLSSSVLVALVTALSLGIFLNSELSIAIVSTGGSTLFFLLLLIIPDIPKSNRSLRFIFLIGFAGFSGIGLANIFKKVIKREPVLSISGLAETCLIFSALSACAILSDRGRWLCLGFPLTVLLFTLIIISFANVIDESTTVSRAIVYLSLFAICGLVLYDTQSILERFRRGDFDVIRQSMSLFTDFIGIYRRLLIIGLHRDNREPDYMSDADNREDSFFGVLSTTAIPMEALL